MSTATSSSISLQESALDLTRRAVYVKVHFVFFGNIRKANNARVDVDADKALVRVSKTLLDSQELKAIKTLDGEIDTARRGREEGAQKGNENVPFWILDGFAKTSVSLGMNGGDDETRTRDLCRDRLRELVLQLRTTLGLPNTAQVVQDGNRPLRDHVLVARRVLDRKISS